MIHLLKAAGNSNFFVPASLTRRETKLVLQHQNEAMAKNRQNWGQPPWKIAFRARTTRLPDHVDVAIVGGGFAGLTAAAYVKRGDPKKSVLVLEAGRVGNGASGRTGGMALAQTAAGDLPGLGDVLGGYKKILRELGVRAVKLVPGGTVNAGKVLAGLARAATKAGAQIAEYTRVVRMEFGGTVSL